MTACGEYDATEKAVSFARIGCRVFPALVSNDEEIDKKPQRGYMWKAQASSNVNEVVEDFTNAIADRGQVYVAWALGLDGFVAVDQDVATPPDWFAELEPHAVVSHSRKGRHLIFRNPSGMTPSNSTKNFPTGGWGEVRGAGGYVIVAGPDRVGLDPEALAEAVAFPRPDWLAESDETSDPATPEQVATFLAEHVDARHPGKLHGVAARLDTFELGGFVRESIDRDTGEIKRIHWPDSLHSAAIELACWVAREAAAGFYPAREGFDLLERWWNDQWSARAKRRPCGKRMKQTRGELAGIQRWAIGQALAAPERIEAMRARAAADLDAWKQAQAKRKRDTLARWVEECS